MTTPVSTAPSSASGGGGGGGGGAAPTAGASTATLSAASQQKRAPPPKFPADTLKSHITKLLNAKLIGQTYKGRPAGLTKELADAVKSRMLELQPTGFKYVVQIQLLENLGQGGSAYLSSHWEEGDTVVQELFTNDTLVCTVICFAIRAS